VLLKKFGSRGVYKIMSSRYSGQFLAAKNGARWRSALIDEFPRRACGGEVKIANENFPLCSGFNLERRKIAQRPGEKEQKRPASAN